jgi:ABC-type sugar transport system ATPase subunit
MIAVTKLHVVAGSFALRDVSLALDAGQYGVLMGKTGSGKTTILEAISGLKPIMSGSIQVLGKEVARLKPSERGVGYVPQDRALFPCMSVRQHLSFALELRRWDRRAVRTRVDEIAELLGIGSLLARRPHGLSGGEAQRVALGRALSFHPRVLLLDEPLSALDEETRGDLCQLLKKIQRETHVTTLHVTHSLSEARQLADRVLVLRQGALHEVVPAELNAQTPSTDNLVAALDNEDAEEDGRIRPLSRLPEAAS